MRRSLRRTHLGLWLVLTPVLAALAVYAVVKADPPQADDVSNPELSGQAGER